MFRTKKDVERHVADVLSKIDNENEKNLRGYAFARLFFQVKDYESAKKHLTRFLSVRDHHAASHKLMAQIYCATNNPENALQSYKRSLELDPQQQDIVLKICELYCQLPVDHETARYWADRAEQLFPHHDTVFRLREYLVSAEGEPDRHELENLIASDLAAQPKNVDRRIKLLRLYLDTERVKEAYDHATMIESKQLFPHSIDWYYVLSDIFEAYQEEYGHELDSQFYINYLAALDHLIFLTLAEPHAFALENGKKSSSLNDAAAILLTFDQLLKKAVQKDIREGSWTYFIHHMKGQLYFHMATLLMKRAKMDQGNRKEAFRFSAGLSAVCYAFKPINLLHEVWFSQMEGNRKTFTDFFQKGSLRTSFIGHVLLTLCKDDKSSWIQKIKIEVCIPQVKERIYSRILSSLFQKEKLSSSYFISDTTFEQSSLELPSETSLNEYDLSAFKLCSNSLHHLVWLELHREHAKISSPDVIKEIFKNLQYSNKNLSRGNCESLCVLDLEAYLQATIYQSKFMIERKNSIFRNESFLSYPPDITDALCSTIQATWWKSANDLYHSSVNEKLGEYRRNLQSGLEVIRGIGNHGMEVQLVIHLAHIFASKASALNKDIENKNERNKKKVTLDSVSALYLRATHYWNIALGMLEKLISGKQLPSPKDPMFIGTSKTLSKNEIKAYQDEGQLFLAVRLMDTDKLNEAAESLSKLSSPYGSYYLALTLKKLASQEEKFSSARAALLNKAKNSLLETMDRIKFDKTHPLNKEIYLELEDVENDLAVEQSIANENSSEYADEIDAYEESPIQNSSFLYDNDKSAIHSTPRPSSKFLTSKHSRSFNQQTPVQHFEPSPERLDAQIRALALNQDILVKSVLEQQQALLDSNKSIVEALKQNKDVVEQLKKKLEELSVTDVKVHPKAIKKQPIFIKGQGDEEDFYDPNSILDYYEDAGEEYRAAGYSFDRAARLPHDPAAGAAAPINYVVPPTLPPGPPPALNHYNYQYPHAVLPTPPAVPERASFYHPPGQGLPFNEGQQLPQFHFHVASSAGKPPPPPALSTSLPQVVPGLPPPSASMPPSLSVVHPPVPPMPAPPNPWAKTVSVPHAFQIPLPPSSVIVSTNSLTPIITQVTSSTAQPVATTSHSQLKDLLQTPVSRTVSFTMPSTTIAPTNLATSPSLFSGLNKTPEASKEHTRYDSETATSPDIDGHDLEREVMGDFKPLIPLPEEIVVETGEESEDVLFEDRAKLYRFVDQEWKERGIGVVKILHHEDSGRVRLLMRRDQVLKVCANHYISPNMEILPMKNSDKAWTWVAQDFADEELRPEHFCIRFKTPEIAIAFKTAFEKAVNISKGTESTKITSPKAANAATTSPLSFGSKFLPKLGSWTCTTCYVSNLAEKLQCAACETKKPGSQTSIVTSSVGSVTTTSAISGFDSKFFPKSGSWTCPACYVSNTGEKSQCAACETKKPASQTSTVGSVTTTSVASGFDSKFFPKPGSWTCPACYVSNTGEKSQCAACETKKPGSQTSVVTSTVGSVTTTSVASSFDSKFFPKPGSWTCPACYVSNTGEKLQCAACETKKPGAQTSVAAVGSVTTTSTASDFDTRSSENTVPGSFKFGIPASSSSNAFSAPTSTINTSVNVFGGFTFSSNPVIQEAETPEVKEREILVVSTKSKNGPEVSKLSTPGPFSGFSFKSSPVVTTAQSAFGSFSGFSFSVTTATSSPKTSVSVPSSSLNISNLQNLVQNVTPAFVFSKPSAEKNIPDTVEVKNSAAEPAVSESVITSISSDTPKSSEFVFGVKPATQPTTFTFGLSALSSKPSETIGFKPTLSASNNSPAVFGGATQKMTDTPPNVNIFSGSTRTEPSQLSSIFGGSQKSDGSQITSTEPSQLSSIFGGSQKSDGSQSTSIFGTQKSDPCAGLSSMFNDATKKSEPPVSISSIFGGSSALNSGSKQSTSIFGSLNENKEASKPISIVGGTTTKSETTMFPTLSSTSQSVFNFGSAAQSKGDTGPVEFRFGSPQKYEFNFSGVRPRSPNKTPKSGGPKSPATPSDVEEDEENESFDADSIYFQPVIPLPPKVDVKTGEENEKTLFCKRAKLFRFCSGEWKERGIGDIKILHDEVNQKVRLLMRRDQVLKVCLNHYLTNDISFEKRGDKTLQWAATDFSESEPSPELFALRFKTSEFVDEFLSAIEGSSKSSENTSTPADVNKVVSTFSFKADPTPKTESLFTTGSLSSRFGTANPTVFGNTQSSTEVTASSNAAGFSFQNNLLFKDASQSTFFKASTTSSETKESDNTSKTKKSSEIKDDDVQLVYEATASPEDAALAKQLHLPPNFYLYKNKPPCPGCIGCEDYVPPAKSTEAENTETNSSNTSKTNKSDSQKSVSDMFNTANSLTFADLVPKSESENISAPKKTGFEGAGTPLFANLNNSAEGDGEDDSVVQGPDIHFEPVIPLPELVAVKTGEEDETPIFVNRAKLFRFDPTKKEWKERGVGDLKILEHKEKLRFRIILRRDQVHKIACNHCISETMELSPLSTSQTALCWNALDYSDSQPEASQFAVRFKNKDLLEQFKQIFNDCKKKLKEGGKSEHPTEISVKETSHQTSPAKDVTNVKENVSQTTSSESETNDDEEDDDEDCTEFEKRVSFEIADASDEFKKAGMGILKVVYDDSVYGYHVYMVADDGTCLCDHIIAIQNVIRTENKSAIWAAVDLSVEPPQRRRFRANFSSKDALEEFSVIFEQGKQFALSSEIVEKSDFFMSPPGQQT